MESQKQIGWSETVLLLVLITLVGAFLRFHRLGAQSFWGDEALSALIADSSPFEIWNNHFGSANPEGYYLLLHFWMALMGKTDYALRFLSALLGILGVIVTYQIGRNVHSRRVGLWAAAITTVTPYHVFYSQETRMYALLYFLTCVIILAYIRMWRGHKRRYWKVVYVVSALMGLWTHFFAGLVVGALAIHFLIVRLWPRVGPSDYYLDWVDFVLVHSIIGISFMLYIPHFIQRFQIVTGWRPLPTLGNLLSLPLAFTGSQFVSGTWGMITFGCTTFLTIIIGLQVARALRIGSPVSKWLLLLMFLFLVPMVVSFAVSHVWKSVFTARVLIVVVPAFYLLIAWSAVCTRERRFNQLILALLLPQMLLGLNNWFFDSAYAKPSVRDTVRLVQNSKRSNVPVLHTTAESYMIFEHYAPDIDNRLLIDPVQPRVGERIDPGSVSLPYFWLIIFPAYDYKLQRRIRDDLDARFECVQEQDVDGIPVYLYSSVDDSG